MADSVLVSVFHRNFDGASSTGYLAKEVNEVAGHLACVGADFRIITDDYPVGDFDGIDLAGFDAVFQRIKVAAVPSWCSYSAKKRCVHIVSTSPFRSVQHQFFHVIRPVNIQTETRRPDDNVKQWARRHLT